MFSGSLSHLIHTTKKFFMTQYIKFNHSLIFPPLCSIHLRNYDTSIACYYLVGAYYEPDTVLMLPMHTVNAEYNQKPVNDFCVLSTSYLISTTIPQGMYYCSQFCDADHEHLRSCNR